MNILGQLSFQPGKLTLSPIRSTPGATILAIGLIKEQLFPKHYTKTPTTLVVLKGSILFLIGEEKIQLDQFDSYPIPVNEEHEVLGLEERNAFLLIKDKG